MALKHEFNAHNLMAFLAGIAIEEGVFEKYFDIIYENYTNSYSTEERYEDIYEMFEEYFGFDVYNACCKMPLQNKK